ncbi:hypothetical protein LY28_03759 [Ruminiclostridium sufflavum DSM 19573]|uniref:Uncharacterized protein n=1 Tax=Ruminiclostridium sufflavum DSM 19573 TaxID=1121337 RepID=A0A318XJ70_9FIRM|nr:hypothetical protein [Ruminiclostridium sufflavum]PYG83911.1 hypothetical protein LY28_03759 [Ruminiclostridium sufflavum DSM 19573]
MAFIYEKISETDRQRLNSFNLVSPLTKNKPIAPSKWIIDRERDVFLVSLGGQGFYESEIPRFYALIWKNNVVLVETFRNGVGSLSDGVEISWKITKIEAKESLLKDKDEMIELIKEGLDAEGSGGRRDCVKKVNFDYIASPWFIRDVNK